jgi:histidine triad (HIT) family protein
MQDSIFTRIIKGEIPCNKIYEDAKTMAFLTIEPWYPGHTLVVPKLQIDKFDDLPAEDYQAVFQTVQKVSKHLRTTLGTDRVIMQVFGFDVPHVHVHLMPASDSQAFYDAIAAHSAGEPRPYQPTPEELAETGKRLRMPDDL